MSERKLFSKNDWKGVIVFVILLAAGIISQTHEWVLGVVALLIGIYLGFSAIVSLKKGEWNFFSLPLSVTPGKVKRKKIIIVLAMIQIFLSLLAIFLGVMILFVINS